MSPLVRLCPCVFRCVRLQKIKIHGKKIFKGCASLVQLQGYKELVCDFKFKSKSQQTQSQTSH